MTYITGKDNPADFLSQHLAATKCEKHNVAEEYVNFITNAAIPKTATIPDISKATATDESLIALQHAIKSGSWNNAKVKPFKMLKDEITVNHNNKVLLCGTRLWYVATSLQKRIVQIAYEGHQDQAKTESVLQETVRFPNMDKQVRTELEHCLACQATSQPNSPEPLNVSPMPDCPWDKVKINFYGPLPTGQYILVVIYCYSRFPEIEILPTIPGKKKFQNLTTFLPDIGSPHKLCLIIGHHSKVMTLSNT